jgi:hypothetical protein
MITIDQAWNIVNELNERAHSLSWEYWIKADDAEEDQDSLYEEASDRQREYFWELLDEVVDDDDMEAIWHYCDTDADFRSDFESFYGEIQ